MAMEAWYMDESDADPRLPHRLCPNEFVPLEHLAELGVLYWHLNPQDYENDEKLRHIRETRGYNYTDLLDICPEKLENYEEKLKNFYTEHIHGDEEIRYCLEGCGYFDLMRLFVGEPVWTAYNRPQEEHPARKEYIESFTKKVGVALEAH
ncbi:hypothetical protein ACLB2K_041125 [Fragaria x ananassa]